MVDVVAQHLIEVEGRGFGNFLDPKRTPFDAPDRALVEADVPEYTRNGLGRCLLQVTRYRLSDTGSAVVEGASICADSSRGHLLYEDMRPAVVGRSHGEAQSESGAPPKLIDALYKLNYPLELITLAALRHHQFGELDDLLRFLDLYRQRASWMESHSVDVVFQNVESLHHADSIFDWANALAHP